MKTNGNLFTLNEAQDLMGRRYQVTRRFGPMTVGDMGSIVDVRAQGEDGYLLLLGAPKRGDPSVYKLAPLTPREMLYLQEIEIQEPVDVLVTCGEEFWASPETLIREIQKMGFSHRIPNTFDARRIKRGISRAFLGHNRAVMQIADGSYDDVLKFLSGETDPVVQEIVQQPYLHEPSRILDLPTTLRGKVCRKFGITFTYGIFGYVYLTGCTYYLKPDEDAVPQDVSARGYKGARVTRVQEQVVIESKGKDEE